MTTRLLLPKIAIFLLALLMLSLWWVYGRSEQKVIGHETDTAGNERGSSVSSDIMSQKINEVAYEGVSVNNDKSLISVRFAKMPRLMVIQRMAEVAGFSFSLPDDAIDYWQESLTVNISNEPLQIALTKIIGTKNFNLEVIYDSAIANHRISAVFLGGNNTVQQVALSPVGLNEPIPFEREAAEGPASELASSNENRVKRDNFYVADTQTKVALLNEMSPVGEDLNYILTSLQKDEQAAVRIAAAHRLSFSESYLATQSLLDALSDKDESVVKAAVNSLVALGDATILPVIASKFAKNEHMQVVLVEAKNRMASRYNIVSDQQP